MAVVSLRTQLRRACARVLAVTAVCVASGAASAAPIVGPFTPGYIGTLSNNAALLVGAHPNDPNPFYDLFAFTVDRPANAFAATFDITEIDGSLPASDGATILGIALYNALGSIIAADGDGADGFSFSVLLPDAGNYALLIVGVGGAGAGIYAAVLSANDVPEPATLSLGAVALCLAAWARRRGSASRMA